MPVFEFPSSTRRTAVMSDKLGATTVGLLCEVRDTDGEAAVAHAGRQPDWRA